MTAQVLASTERHLLARLAAEQVTARVPSIVAGVVRDGGLAWCAGRGSMVSPDGPSEPGADTQYRIGSITKIMTAVLVLQLRDEGTLHLRDRLGDHLPAVPYGDRTLRELLSHSSGMSAEPPGPWWERSPGMSFETVVGGLDDSLAPFPPGQQHHYSNVAYALLGAVVERHRGAPWFDVLRDRVLRPLEMRRTTYSAASPAATGFSVDTFAGTLTVEPSHDSAAMAPAGQLWSTVEDLARLGAFLLDPSAEVLAPDTVTEMTTGQAGTPDSPAGGSYGLGLRLHVAADRSYVGHTGSVPGFLAGLFVDRGRSTGGVFLANGADGVRAQGFPIELITLLQEHEPWVPAAWTPTAELAGPVRDLLGLWYWGNLALTMGWEGDRLVARVLAGNQLWCTFRVDETGFRGVTGYFAGEVLRPVRRSDGVVGHLECATFIFTRVPYDPAAPIPGGAP